MKSKEKESEQIEQPTDSDLLRSYVSNHSQEAFSLLYERYKSLVYNACSRRLRGNSTLAKEAVQGVFLVLARKAKSLLGYDTLAPSHGNVCVHGDNCG